MSNCVYDGVFGMYTTISSLYYHNNYDNYYDNTY